ncbi:hypothetical protein [Halorubellus litoreus]|uniref:Uncharacterized protein n=1 Tax=Halorubellus litoreus TaxID=755308 RepID=A0ABD5VFQ9_9EURY
MTWNYVAVGQYAAIQAIDCHDPSTGHAVDVRRTSTDTGGQKELEFRIENVDDDTVDAFHFAATNVNS